VQPSSSPGTFVSRQWGLSTDTPVVGDYDGDGQADFGVWRPDSGTWYMLPSGSSGYYTATQWGALGDLPLSPITSVMNAMP
jgi:hypothetical protein